LPNPLRSRLWQANRRIIVGHDRIVQVRRYETGHFTGESIWQARFYDHIIRNDIELHFIRQSVELNPLMWEYGIDSPQADSITAEEFKHILKEKFNTTGEVLVMIICSKRIRSVKWVD
jgi:hypothetical protein